MEITERLDNIEKLLDEAKAKTDRALADCPPFLKANNRPALAFYHANARGTGCAAKWTLHPATNDRDGHIGLTLAPQMTVGDARAIPPVLPRFDWDEGAIATKLNFGDLCAILQVFRGETESIRDGQGLYHEKIGAGAFQAIRLSHVLEPVPGYSLDTYECRRADKAEKRARIFLTSAEALGICAAIEASMGAIAFGIPAVIPHE